MHQSQADTPLSSLISTGLGRLHLVQSAQYLAEAEVDVELVQGWVPKRAPKALVQFLGRLAGSPHLYAGMVKRRAEFLDHTKVHNFATPEFFAQVLFKFSNLGIIGRGTAASLGWNAFGRATKGAIRQQDIFHVRSGAGRGGAIAKAKKNGVKVICDHSIAHPAFIERVLSEEYENAGIPFWINARDQFWANVLQDCIEADRIVVNSHFVKDTFVSEGFDAEKISVCYLGVREDFGALKNDYNISGPTRLLFTGGFNIRKGARYLIEAIEILRDRGVDVILDIVGESSEGKKFIEQSDVSSRVKCFGFIPQEDLKMHLSRADIYVFPSLAEGCASSGMEAMASGLPVVATKESGLPINNGVNGLQIASKSADAVANAVQTLIHDRDLREKIGRSSTRLLKEKYSWPEYARNMKEIYRSLQMKST